MWWKQNTKAIGGQEHISVLNHLNNPSFHKSLLRWASKTIKEPDFAKMSKDHNAPKAFTFPYRELNQIHHKKDLLKDTNKVA